MSLSRRRYAHTTSACLVSILLVTSACGGAQVQAVAPTPAEARPPSPSPDAIWVRFEAEETDQHWSVLGADEKILCQLPCSRWITGQSGAFLQDDIPGTITSIRVSLPNDLGPPGGSIVAVARRGEAKRRAGTKLIIGGVSVAILSLILFFALTDVSDHVPDIVLGSGATAGVALAGLGLYFRYKSHPPDVAVQTASAAPRVTFALGAPPAGDVNGVSVRLTPLGIAGTF
jgi:hypothetical protein